MNNTSNLKKSIAEISPEHIQMDMFIQEMDKLFDKKLGHLATKEDVNGIKNDVALLLEENKVLREEIIKLKEGETQLKKKIEETEKFTKRMNAGLKHGKCR